MTQEGEGEEVEEDSEGDHLRGVRVLSEVDLREVEEGFREVHRGADPREEEGEDQEEEKEGRINLTSRRIDSFQGIDGRLSSLEDRFRRNIMRGWL